MAIAPPLRGAYSARYRAALRFAVRGGIDRSTHFGAAASHTTSTEEVLRPPKLAIRMAAGAFAVAVALGVGVAGAAAAPNPGFGTKGYTIIPSVTGPPAIPAVTNNAPLLNLPSPSHEQAEDGPQTANVPTLAWVGEDVRLVACDDNIVANPLGRDDINFEQANWSSGTGNDLWTGDQAAPRLSTARARRTSTSPTPARVLLPAHRRG